MDPPQILRIKRKRGQDPLQALILGDSQVVKRSKPSSPRANSVPQPLGSKSYYFHLAETNQVSQPDSEVLASVLSEARVSGTGKRKRQFVIPKQQTDEDTVIPHELAEMLDDLLVDDAPRAKRKRGGRNRTGEDNEGARKNEDIQRNDMQENDIQRNGMQENDMKESLELAQSGNEAQGGDGSAENDYDDYVFDVYKLSTADTLTNANYPQSQIGYIRFYDDDEFDLLQSDDETRSQTILSDDEDSNAESFYQNDYPEDEDAGTYSDSYETENFGPIIVDSAEDAEGHAYLSGHVQADMAEPQHFDDLYDDFFDEDGNQVASLIDDDCERQNFFENEEDDALARHRDRIFGRLQKMIDEAP